MKMRHLFQFAASAAVLVLSACASNSETAVSTEEKAAAPVAKAPAAATNAKAPEAKAPVAEANAKAPADNPIVTLSDSEIRQMEAMDFEAIQKMGLTPGRIYVSEEFAEVFLLKEMTSRVDEHGMLNPRVIGATKPYSFWTWLWKGEEPYILAFRFLWFDKDGKMMKIKYNKIPRIRRCLPNDPVRFSALAQDEKCTQYCLCVDIINEAEEKEIMESLKNAGAEQERENPTKVDPLKEVKVAK